MNSIARCLAAFAAGLFLSAQTMGILKRVNEQEGAAKISDHMGSAVIDESEIKGRESLGSEQISDALQHILNGDRNSCSIYLHAKYNNIAKGRKYALGSESLNRILEDIMNTAESRNEVSFDPAMEI
ncbi:uncharacterized protein LOC110181146 [Drosophila serrata]|uniref:uncharacterized protein LOC110181146 n=1 Tax=Drosophila serrata TaxID=7274 RepID=UPI000A1D315E|nr:uncharacterized protein LOC110181146 [Drosophila serrata]KAH8381021.1 hypothetical protein KR200_008443 [Drosophila serrata]